MKQQIAHITLMVKEYDEAIAFYTQKLDFKLLEDTPLSESKRWVLVGPSNPKGCNLLLAKAVNEDQKKCIGNQTGGRVFLFLQTDDFFSDYDKMIKRGIHFAREPRKETYGYVAVFEDLYGNLWDLIGPS